MGTIRPLSGGVRYWRRLGRVNFFRNQWIPCNKIGSAAHYDRLLCVAYAENCAGSGGNNIRDLFCYRASPHNGGEVRIFHIASESDSKRFKTTSQTWLYLLNVNVFDLNQHLPGVFISNPEQSQVNGSLCTLPIECGFYVLLPVMAVTHALKPRAALVVLLAVIMTYVVSVFYFHLEWNNQGGQLFRGAQFYSTIRNFLFFFIGSCFWLWRGKIVYSNGLAIAMLGLLYLFVAQQLRTAAFYIALPYLVMYTAGTRQSFVGRYQKLGDYSYGTYIFAYPVQQGIVATMGAAIGPMLLCVFAAPITFALAFLSWRFVERPALKLRKRLFRPENAELFAARAMRAKERFDLIQN